MSGLVQQLQELNTKNKDKEINNSLDSIDLILKTEQSIPLNEAVYTVFKTIELKVDTKYQVFEDDTSRSRVRIKNLTGKALRVGNKDLDKNNNFIEIKNDNEKTFQSIKKNNLFLLGAGKVEIIEEFDNKHIANVIQTHSITINKQALTMNNEELKTYIT